MIEAGSIVMAKSGHDKGNHYVVIGKESERYLYIANGKQHPLEAPKKKNIKHIVLVQNAEKFEIQGEPTNKQVRRYLNRLQTSMGGLING